MQTEQILLRPSEAATRLALARSTLYLLIASGELPVVRIGRAVRLPLAALDEWVEKRTETKSRGGEDAEDAH